MAKKITGFCACGSIRYQPLDKPMFVHCCHCDDCQRLTGSAFVLNAIIETQAIKLLRGKPVAVPVPRENGSHDIYRCPRCQTALWSDVWCRAFGSQILFSGRLRQHAVRRVLTPTLVDER